MTILAINYISNRIAKFSTQIANRIAMLQIKSLHLKSNRQTGSNRNSNPNRDVDLLNTVRDSPMVEVVWWSVVTE